jgi:glycosyltransferase involved in cell wall biosynthesis
MTRFAASRRVLYVEEPMITSSASFLHRTVDGSGVEIIVPHLREGADRVGELRGLLDHLIAERATSDYVLWYYTPMAREWSNHLSPTAVVYDCMDELSLFKGAPHRLGEWERELLGSADVVFMGGQSLFEAKRDQHSNSYVFPSSIDFTHFAKGRRACADPVSQEHIPHPRLGYAGVIDERMDLDLLEKAADSRPDWHFVLLGPVVKIDEAALPRRNNIHYLGMQPYAELPSYLGNWDVGLLPFARNDSTRFISPTKTPEYLASGLPAVSTSIRDVVRPYGDAGLVHIADTVGDFINAVEKALIENRDTRFAKVDQFLANNSWAKTWGRMNELLEDATLRRAVLFQPKFQDTSQGQTELEAAGAHYYSPSSAVTPGASTAANAYLSSTPNSLVHGSQSSFGITKDRATNV